MVLKNQLLYKSGLNENEFKISAKDLSEAVKRSPKEFSLYFSFTKDKIIGKVKNIHYIHRKVLGDISFSNKNYFNQYKDRKFQLSLCGEDTDENKDGSYGLVNPEIYACFILSSWK